MPPATQGRRSPPPCEQGRRPLSLVLTAGQRGDSPQFTTVLERIRVNRPGPGRPRCRPRQALADKAHSSRANRAYPRRRGIRCVIPVKADQQAHRRAKGSHGGRPPAFDPVAYRQRHAVEAEVTCGDERIVGGEQLAQMGNVDRTARRPESKALALAAGQ